MEDMPAEVAQATRSLAPSVQISIQPHLGSHPGLHRLMTERMAAIPVEAWILVSHGSSRPGANQTIESLAHRLGAVSAFCACMPNLETRLLELMHLGMKKIGILPYFLFSGKTTDAIAQTVSTVSQKFPILDLIVTPPIDATPDLADLLVDLAMVRAESSPVC